VNFKTFISNYGISAQRGTATDILLKISQSYEIFRIGTVVFASVIFEKLW
jgi:hypothetical protein